MAGEFDRRARNSQARAKSKPKSKMYTGPGYWSGTGVAVGPYSTSTIKKAKKAGYTVTPVDPARSYSSSTASTYSGSSSSSGGSSSPAPAAPSGPSEAEKAAIARAEAAEKAAAEAKAKAIKQANSSARGSANKEIDQLNQQITAKSAQKKTNQNSLDALKKLVSGGLQGSRDDQLAALDAAMKTKLTQIQQTFDTSIADFNKNLRDNEKTEADASFSNLANRAREKGDLVTQALSQGAGESDILKSQLQALRNWSSNQADVNRSFFDTRASVNAGITDLNNATKTGMINEENSTNASKGGVWNDFYDSLSDSYTQMSNLDQQNYLLQGEIDTANALKGQSQGVLDWLDAGKNYEDYEEPKKGTAKAAKAPAYESQYADKAAAAAGSSWKNPGVSDATKNWKGGKESTGGLTSASVKNAQANESGGKKKRPEGASLRKW